MQKVVVGRMTKPEGRVRVKMKPARIAKRNESQGKTREREKRPGLDKYVWTPNENGS